MNKRQLTLFVAELILRGEVQGALKMTKQNKNENFSFVKMRNLSETNKVILYIVFFRFL